MRSKVHELKSTHKERLISEFTVAASLAVAQAAAAAAAASEAAAAGGEEGAAAPDQLDEDHYNAYHVVEAILDKRPQKARSKSKSSSGMLQYRLRARSYCVSFSQIPQFAPDSGSVNDIFVAGVGTECAGRATQRSMIPGNRRRTSTAVWLRNSMRGGRSSA